MNKLLLLLTLGALAPLASSAQSNDGGYEEYKNRIAIGEMDEQARRAREAGQKTAPVRLGRYDANGDYIYGSNPYDTPFNTYPGPGSKRRLEAWRRYRDSYNAQKDQQKALKARGKANRRARKADEKAHGGTKALPGGYRWDEKKQELYRPDGTRVSGKKN